MGGRFLKWSLKQQLCQARAQGGGGTTWLHTPPPKFKFKKIVYTMVSNF